MIPKLRIKIKCQAMLIVAHKQTNKTQPLIVPMKRWLGHWKSLGHSSLQRGWMRVPRLPVSTEKSGPVEEALPPLLVQPWLHAHWCWLGMAGTSLLGSCACPSQGDIVSDILKAEIQPPNLCCCQIRIVLCGQASRQSWGNGEALKWRQVHHRLPAAPEQGEPGERL